MGTTTYTSIFPNMKVKDTLRQDLHFELREKVIERQMGGYRPECYHYSLDKLPNERFADHKTIFATHSFCCCCYNHMNELSGKKAFFKIDASDTNNRDYITYGDVFIQCDKQLKSYLNEIIEKYSLTDMNFKDLLCNHIFMEMLTSAGKSSSIQYDIFCGS